MSEPDDYQLLGEFVRSESEPAFAALVARYINLVYSTALRATGNAHHAQEITQAVFVILARKAAKLSPRVVLSGWLYQTARLTAANFKKGEIRRQLREQEVYMQSMLNESTDAAWNDIAPLLDEAMGRLGETDRNAIVLRFFENKSSAEIGTALRMNEEAARKRVNRALEKLRGFFTKRGVVSTTAIIAGVISANSVHAAPIGLGQTITVTAVGHTVLPTTITTLVKSTMKTMTWIKLKFAAGVAVSIILAAGVTTVAVSQIGGASDPSQMTPEEIVQHSEDAYAALSSYQDDGTVTGTIGTTTVPPHTFTTRLAHPNLYRIAWQQNMGSFSMAGMTWSAGSGNFVKITSGSQPTKFKDMKNAFAMTAGVSGGASSTVPMVFFNQNMSKHFGGLPLPATRKADETLGDIDCYVLTHNGSGYVETMWISKKDFLVRQLEVDVNAAQMQKTLQAAEQQNPQAKGIARNTPTGNVVLTETHENIVLNQTLSASSFAP